MNADAIANTRLTVASGGLTYVGARVADLQTRGVPDAAILAAFQAALGARVDAAAEQLREAILTPGAGQAMEYQELRIEALAALAAPAAATPVLYPMLAASVGIDVDPSNNAPAADVLGVARAVLAQTAAWVTLGAAIRAARMKGKAAIAAAADLAAAGTAYDAVSWPAKPAT